ncbi:uncharacterized protein LOC121051716 [Rosa chinensis]|uniref:uncharacterized protein LOC121051716 n=1 Tax=Rosa chinensis TaxID=74649 RepID=UPI001AD918FF|nr:uncharacterized protein LOC121051716 [Rosa chinensis]
MLARFPEDATRSQPLPVTQPTRAPRPVQAGIVIREPPLEGTTPRSGARTIRASPAAGQSGKQKAVLAEPEAEDSSSDDDNPQTLLWLASATARTLALTHGKMMSHSLIDWFIAGPPDTLGKALRLLVKEQLPRRLKHLRFLVISHLPPATRVMCIWF